MNRSTAILTILAAVALSVAATACDPRPLAAAPSTPPPATAGPGATQPPTAAPSATPSGSGTTATPAPSDTPTQAQPTPEPTLNTPTEPAAGDSKIITLDDEGKTIQMAVGESFLLKLGEGYDWSVTVSDQNVVSRVKFIAVVRGAQGVYDALQAGTVTLTATGNPACRQSQPPCMMPSRLFTVTIVVK